MSSRSDSPALAVSGLEVDFLTASGWKPVVRNVSFELERGATLGIVGESGSGKTVTSLAIMGLLPVPPARVRSSAISIAGEAVGDGGDALLDVRGRLAAMIFQEPMTSLNPAYTVGDQIAEVLRRHKGARRRASRDRAAALLERVGIARASERARAYPHELSGGMRQRVMIAMGVACDPALLIADEPTTALDVTVQAEILQLLREIQLDTGMAILFITHDLGIVAEMCDWVAVMYAGEFVELSTTSSMYLRPRHPYTRALLASVPDIRNAGPQGAAIAGSPPVVGALPSGCAFHPRCPHAVEECQMDGAADWVAIDARRWSRCRRDAELNVERDVR